MMLGQDTCPKCGQQTIASIQSDKGKVYFCGGCGVTAVWS